MFAYSCYQYDFGHKIKSVTVNTLSGGESLSLVREGEVPVHGRTGVTSGLKNARLPQGESLEWAGLGLMCMLYTKCNDPFLIPACSLLLEDLP